MTLNTVAMSIVTPTRKRISPMVTASLAFLILITLAAIFAPLIAPHDPNQTNILVTQASPSLEHWFGTDSTGRDTFSRLLYGARLSLLAPLFVALLTTVIGAAVGLTAARAGGMVDLVISRTMDIVFAFPSLLLALLAVAIFGPGLAAPICALAIGYIPFIGRIVRAEALQEQARPYVGSHQVMGFTPLWITVRHILPNILPVLIAQATLTFGYAMLDLAALSYLGLGVLPPAADWGSMISQSQSVVLQGNLWSIIFPSAAVILTVLSVNILGESITDRFSGTAGGKR